MRALWYFVFFLLFTAAPILGQVTYYSYQSGNWNAAGTWTTDPSGTLWVNGAIPTLTDQVVVLNSRTIKINENSKSVSSLMIESGGVLDLQTTQSHNFGIVSGQGLLRSSSVSFPGGDFSGFVSATGGTIEFCNLSGTLPMPTTPANTFNHLLITKDDASLSTYTNILANNLTVNGNLTLNNLKNTGQNVVNIGNNATSRTITINGNVIINTGCTIGVSSYNCLHYLNIYGDLTNTGIIDLNNNALNVANTLGAALITFKGATNNTVSINATTAFYDFFVDKGVDQSSILEVYSSAAVSPFEGYYSNKFSITLVNGTLKLGSNISVPKVMSNGNFDISSNQDNKAGLWIESNASVYFPNPVVVYGKLHVGGNATFSWAPVIVTRESGEVEIEGGSITLGQFRPSNVVTATPRGSFSMSGGVLNINGPSHDASMAIFDWHYTNTSFKMSGGTININAPNVAGAFLVSSSNYDVSGGDVNITIPTGNNASIQSTVPLWNLTILRASGSAKVSQISSLPLTVLNKLTLLTSNNPVLDANGQNLILGGNFYLPAGTTYTPSSNTTFFNSSGGQVFDNLGTITGGLYNLNLKNGSNITISKDLPVSNMLTIDSTCFLNDNGNYVQVTGNVSNSGTHISKANGGIVMTGTSAQTVGGSGRGIFGNFIVNKTSGTTTLTANQILNGHLRLQTGILDLDVYNLQLNAAANVYDGLTGTGSSFSATKMVRTSGNPSDGGLSRNFNAPESFLYPVGTGTLYAPATIHISASPLTWGTIAVKPVPKYHALTTSSHGLNYYWKVMNSGFSGLASNSVSLIFRYNDASQLGRGTEANYIPGVYNPTSWAIINDISKVVDNTNDMLFNAMNSIDGEYTAGEIDAFQQVKVFYSRQNGNWNDYQTWSTDSVGGTAVPNPSPGAGVPGIHYPGPSNPVVIGNGLVLNHKVTIPAAFSSAIVGSLQINQGSTLDVTTSTGHNFGNIANSKVLGTGTIRISSSGATAVFPDGDFGSFLSSGGGTVEYYTTGSVGFALPSTSLTSHYNHLVISPAAGQTIQLPPIDLKVFGNLETNGSGLSYLNSANSKQLSVSGNITVKQGYLRFMNNNQAQTVLLDGNLTINSGATFDVSTASNALNTMIIKGGITNNGTLDLYGNSANAICDVTFKGETNQTFSGTATYTELNYLTVDKGSSRNVLLDVTVDKLILSGSGNALRLTNGTFRVSNPSLSFTLSSTNSFTIPQTGCLSVSYGTVNIGTNSDNGDLLLSGRLEVLNSGTVNIGNGGNYNNDIEYSPSGIPELVVRDNAALNVNGQIRRGNSVTGGSLSFTQSGGNILISGKNQLTSRGKLEVLNTGSLLALSGGTIVIENGGGSSSWFGDVLLDPDNFSVTGGTLQLGNSATVSTTFLVNSASPLWNLMVDGTTSNKTVGLRIHPLVLYHDLTINGNSVFLANGWNVTLRGNLTNNNGSSSSGIATGGFQAGTASQVTTFNGVNQTITGKSGNLTNFANLVIAGSGNVGLGTSSEVLVNKNLKITSGSLSDNGNLITLMGDADNSGAHLSGSNSGGIKFAGSATQTITGSGNGKFGNVVLQNPQNVFMTDNTEVDGLLTFTSGSLYIDDYLLTLGVNASIGGSPGTSDMILLNGALSDRGVRKYYPTTASDFTFPIGVSGKYTPARFSISSAGTEGFIRILPVNSRHPNLQDAVGNELAYYWVVSSSGLTPVTVQQRYTYLASDVSGTESSYITGRYLQGNWTPLGGISGTVNSGIHQISMLSASSVNYIDGEYTAGDPANFSSIPVYYSRVSGNWESSSTWSTDPVLKYSGAAASAPPKGNPVYIGPGHTISVNVNGQSAYSVNIPATSTLDLKKTIYHSLGYLSGGGTLSLTSTDDGMFVMPGGNYDSLMSVSTSTIVFYNPSTTIPATLPAKPGNIYKPFQHVTFTGNGIKNIPADDMRVLGNITISAGLFNNSLYNRNLYLRGNWIDDTSNGSVSAFNPGNGMVIFEGTSLQQLKMSDTGATGNFYDIQVNNAQGVTLSGLGKVNLTDKLLLTNGNINTNATNILNLSNPSPFIVSGGGPASFVNGPLQKNITSGSYFNFPVGKNGRWGNLYTNTVSPGGTVEAEFYSVDPASASMPVTSKILPIDTVTISKYWRLNTPASSSANVRILWDATDISGGFIPGTVSSRSKLRLVQWTGSGWVSKGNVVNDGQKTVQSTSVLPLSGNNYFGLGIESLPTAVLTSGSSSLCNNGSAVSVPINLSGTPPWTIRYKVNGGNETTLTNIATTPYALVISNATDPLTNGPGVYHFKLSYVSDATGSTGIKDFMNTYQLTLNESPLPVITGNTTVPGGQTAMYSTPDITGHTYSWVVTGGTITAGQNTHQITVTWGGGPTGSVVLTETVTLGGCAKTTSGYAVNITDIPNPLITGNGNLCAGGANEKYSTPDVGSHTYSWTVTGGVIVSGANTHEVFVSWTTPGTGLVSVTETGSAPRTATMNVTVNPVPDKTNTVTFPTICVGQTASIVVKSANAGITYQLQLASDHTAVGTAISSGPGGDVTLTASPVVNTTYSILASNEYGCTSALNTTGTVVVLPVPGTGTIYRTPNR